MDCGAGGQYSAPQFLLPAALESACVASSFRTLLWRLSRSFLCLWCCLSSYIEKNLKRNWKDARQAMPAAANQKARHESDRAQCESQSTLISSGAGIWSPRLPNIYESSAPCCLRARVPNAELLGLVAPVNRPSTQWPGPHWARGKRRRPRAVLLRIVANVAKLPELLRKITFPRSPTAPAPSIPAPAFRY
jgi:hypothetical protein